MRLSISTTLLALLSLTAAQTAPSLSLSAPTLPLPSSNPPSSTPRPSSSSSAPTPPVSSSSSSPAPSSSSPTDAPTSTETSDTQPPPIISSTTYITVPFGNGTITSQNSPTRGPQPTSGRDPNLQNGGVRLQGGSAAWTAAGALLAAVAGLAA